MEQLRQLYAKAGPRRRKLLSDMARSTRNYLSKVRRIVDRWREEVEEPTLAWLSTNLPDRARLRMSRPLLKFGDGPDASYADRAMVTSSA
jgi:hypothetical protein